MNCQKILSHPQLQETAQNVKKKKKKKKIVVIEVAMFFSKKILFKVRALSGASLAQLVERWPAYLAVPGFETRLRRTFL